MSRFDFRRADLHEGIKSEAEAMRMTFTVLTLLTALGLLIGIGLPKSLGAQSYNWTGFYAGAQTGFAKPKDFVRYGGSSTGAPFDSVDQTISHRENGFAPGGQAGYNHQFGWIVPGLEADLATWGLTAAACRRRNSIPATNPRGQFRRAFWNRNRSTRHRG